MDKIPLAEMDKDSDNEWYLSADGRTIRRARGGVLSPNGNRIDGLWVLRDGADAYIDHDQYRTDLIERHDFSTHYVTLRDLLAQEFA